MTNRLSILRDEGCTLCRQYETTDDVCQMGFGSNSADVFVVSKMPNSSNYQKMIEEELINAGLDLYRVYFTSATKCRTFDRDPSNADVKLCSRTYLGAEIAAFKPKWVLAFGNEALLACTGHSGISKYRGRPIFMGDYTVVATVAPGSVMRNPGHKQSWQADIQFFVSQILDRPSEVQPPRVHTIDTKVKLKKLIGLLGKADLISYDIETASDNKGATEFDPNAVIVSLAGTLMIGDRQLVFALPLAHPESPWRKSWRSVLKHINPSFSAIKKQIAHNGKFDARWLRHFGVEARVTFDTMLAAHILDENRVKGLKPLSRIFLGVAPWEISTASLLNTPLDQVLYYNALDTYYTYHLYLIFKEQLVEQPRLLRLFTKLIIPAAEDFIDIERHGVYLDRERLASAVNVSFQMRDNIEAELMKHVPEDRPTDAKGRPLEPNFNASNFARWWLFEHLKFPILARGKEKADGTAGAPSMAEAVMLELKKTNHEVPKLLLERVKWQKYCSSFVVPYQELLDDDNRIHTTFKLAGTVTGRLSSGKADAEKVTSARGKMRGVNLQQVPRDPFIRGLFGAPPGWSFVEADFSQVELRVVAFISRDATMLRIYQLGQDIHTATAANVLGVPISRVTKDDRKKAKAVNFGFVYGMGWKKFIQTAFEKYELEFTEYEAKEVRKAFFEQFRGLLPWHARQRRLVHAYGRVQSPLGRIRHLPDVFSGDQQVVAEAERQAINSPIQSFASDMNLLSMILINQEFKRLGIRGFALGTVHDAINFEIHDDDLAIALPLIKDTMQNLPLERKFGVSIDVPIVADLKVGAHWGDAKELSEEDVYGWATRAKH